MEKSRAALQSEYNAACAHLGHIMASLKKLEKQKEVLLHKLLQLDAAAGALKQEEDPQRETQSPA